ncbi:MAG: hypothetical protein QF858_01620, partial [Candidatus Pacebacteria bacterium]|nr:hypothetical protein [Candidatus Paceibacterota bacterium]
SCMSPDVGEAKTVVPVKYSGDELVIGLNPDFVLDFLKNVNTKDIRLDMKDPGTAGVFKAGGGCTYVVMPMNLEEESVT